MLEAMNSAEIGDDVFGEDISTNKLENYVAKLFGFPAALFCMSGTMANQIAIHLHVRPGDEIICDELSHVYLYEGGGIASNSMASVQLLKGDRGRLMASDIESVIKEDNVHYPISRLVCLENTVNKGGGSIYPISQLKEIREMCLRRNLNLHLDGARLWNAMIETGDPPEIFAEIFDSISVCLSKGLGAPMGSVLLGSEQFIHNARRVRKRWGGGWRQSGYMAAAGHYAITNQFSRLKEDHRRAKEIGQILSRIPFVAEVLPVETNIVILSLDPAFCNAADFVKILQEKGVFCSAFGKQQVRMVTHIDFTDHHLQILFEILTSLLVNK